MTTDRDFKDLVRARMTETGQPYAAARADLLAERDAARVAQERLVARLFPGGRLTHIPAKRKTRAAVLLHLVTLFEPHRAYPERELNEILGAVHKDYAYLRRELVNYGYLTRADGIYRLADRAPRRDTAMLQELPAWEAHWLPGHLRG